MRCLEQEEDASTQEQEEHHTQKRPLSKALGTGGGGGTWAKAKVSKPSANALSRTTPQALTETYNQQASKCLAAHFTPSEQTKALSSAAVAANPEVDAQQALQANVGKGGPKGAKQRPTGWRKSS